MTTPRQARATPDGRKYVHPITKDRFRSVTNILGVIDKPALKHWAARMAAQFAFDHRDTWVNLPRAAAVDLMKREALRYTGRASDIGTAVHDAAERYVEGEIALGDADDEIAGFVRSFVQFLEDFKPTYRYLESTVYSWEHGYAGTLDAIVDIPGRGCCVLDIKTGKSVWPEAALQLAAYAHADELVLGPPWERQKMPHVDGAVVLQLRPRKYELVEMDIGPDVRDAFLSAAALAEFKSERFGMLVGDPLTPRPLLSIAKEAG